MEKKTLKILLYATIFGLSVAIMLGSGLYRKSIPNESATFKIELPADVEGQNLKPIIFDIQNEGLPKKLFQPGRISITHSAIKNKGKEPIWIQVQAQGFEGTTRQITSSDPSFDKKTESFNSPILPGKSLSLGINLNLPLEDVNRDYQISVGAIVLSDSKSGKLLAKIPVSITNSKFYKLTN